MKRFASLTTLLLATTTPFISASALPFLPQPGALCPQIFKLIVATPNHPYSGYNVIESGRSLFLYNGVPSSDDDIARFYQNDTTQLYATGFNIDYIHNTHWTPPYQLYAFNVRSGFTLFSPTAVEESTTGSAGSTTGGFSVANGELQFQPDNTDGPGGWWVCGSQVQLGTVDLSHGSGNCTLVKMQVVDLDPIAADVC